MAKKKKTRVSVESTFEEGEDKHHREDAEMDEGGISNSEKSLYEVLILSNFTTYVYILLSFRVSIPVS